jgi:uncharacterized membrane protein YcaP (DUF421 family)
VGLTDLYADMFAPGISIVEKVVRTIIVYFVLIALLRLGGRRQTSQLNSFDLVVLLVLSNTVQNAIIGNDNLLIGGVIGAVTLVVLNYAVNRLMMTNPSLERHFEGDSVVLVQDGRLLAANMRREMITKKELEAVVHIQGIESIEQCEEVRFEAGGAISVIADRSPGPDNAELLSRLNAIESKLDRLGERPPAA